jgi:type I restriction enzyme S subunit
MEQGVGMKKGWEMKMLGDFSKISYGYTAKASFKQNGFKFLRITDIQENHVDWDIVPSCQIEENDFKKYALCEGDIVFARTGATTGKSFLIKNPPQAVFASYLIKVQVAKKIINADFLLYFFQSKQYWDKIAEGTSGSAQGGFNATKLAELVIPLPLLPEQQRIVTILDEAFAAIAKAKENAEKNLANAREVFESYLQNVFANPKDTWEKKTWGQLCNFVRGPFGGSLKKSIFKSEGYVVYEQQHAIHDHFTNLRYFIDEAKFNEMKRFELKTGDLIMSCSGVTLGRVAIVPDNIPPGIINQALLKLTPLKGVSVQFLKYWLRSKPFQDIIARYSKGAAIPNVPSAKILKEIRIPIPSIKEQHDIVTNIELVIDETKKLETIFIQKLADLDELKKSILEKAFAGELKTEKE